MSSAFSAGFRNGSAVVSEGFRLGEEKKLSKAREKVAADISVGSAAKAAPVAANYSLAPAEPTAELGRGLKMPSFQGAGLGQSDASPDAALDLPSMASAPSFKSRTWAPEATDDDFFSQVISGYKNHFGNPT